MIKKLTTAANVRAGHKHEKCVNKRIDRFFAAALTGYVSKYGIQDTAAIEQIAQDCLYIAEGALEVLVRNHYSSEPPKYRLYANTQHGVGLADFDDFGEFRKKGVLYDEDFLQALATCKDGEILYGVVIQEVFDKIREEYGVRE